MPIHLKTVGYGLSYAVAGLVFLFGAIIATVIQLFLGYYENWIAILAVYILSIIYIFYFVPESLVIKKRKNLTLKNCNPLRPLFHVLDNPIIGWISVIYFCISLPQAGIIGILLVFFSEQLNAKGNDAVLINSLFLVSIGIGALFFAAIIIPKLKQIYNDEKIVEIGILLCILCQICFVIFAFYPNIALVPVGGFLFFSVAISNSSLNSIITQYVDELSAYFACVIFFIVS